MENELEILLEKGNTHISKLSNDDLSYKASENKWSKKEILGHLIDSGLYNLQRFTEIQFAEKPYQIKTYNQVALVKANDYQNAKIDELLNIWLALNYRITYLISIQTATTFAYKINLGDEVSDLKFLFKDYIAHLAHHLQQIMK